MVKDKERKVKIKEWEMAIESLHQRGGIVPCGISSNLCLLLPCSTFLVFIWMELLERGSKI